MGRGRAGARRAAGRAAFALDGFRTAFFDDEAVRRRGFVDLAERRLAAFFERPARAFGLRPRAVFGRAGRRRLLDFARFLAAMPRPP